MPRAVIRLKDNSYLNIPADGLNFVDGWLMAWDGDTLVAVVRAEELIEGHIFEKKEGEKNG